MEKSSRRTHNNRVGPQGHARLIEGEPYVDRMLVRVHHLLKRDDGQDLIEYGLLAVLIATGAILAISSVGSELNTLFWVPIANAV